MYNKTSHYVSVDIEAGGPVPFHNKLLSIGAISYSKSLQPLETFYMTIDDYHGIYDENTLSEFWMKNPKAYQEIEYGQYPNDIAIKLFVDYVRKYGDAPRFVARPSWFDYGWLRVYMLRYAECDPFEMRVCDYGQQAFAMGIKLTKKNNPFPHHALHDAIEQGEQFVEFMKKREQRKKQYFILENQITMQKEQIRNLERKLKHISTNV